MEAERVVDEMLRAILMASVMFVMSGEWDVARQVTIELLKCLRKSDVLYQIEERKREEIREKLDDAIRKLEEAKD